MKKKKTTIKLEFVRRKRGVFTEAIIAPLPVLYILQFLVFYVFFCEVCIKKERYKFRTPANDRKEVWYLRKTFWKLCGKPFVKLAAKKCEKDEVKTKSSTLNSSTFCCFFYIELITRTFSTVQKFTNQICVAIWRLATVLNPG